MVGGMVPRVLLLALLPAVISLLAGANVAAEPAARNLDTHQRDVIKRFVLREAKASIVSPRQGEPHDFAAALASALREAGAWVANDSVIPSSPARQG